MATLRHDSDHSFSHGTFPVTCDLSGLSEENIKTNSFLCLHFEKGIGILSYDFDELELT